MSGADLAPGPGPLAPFGCHCPWETLPGGIIRTKHRDGCPTLVPPGRITDSYPSPTNWANVLRLDPIPDLDPGIAPWVELLRAHRVETYESCQGGPDPERPDRGHAYPEPTIAFHGSAEAGYRCYAIAVQHGLPVRQICRVWKHDDHELSGPTWQIVFSRQATGEDARNVAEVLAFERGDR